MSSLKRQYFMAGSLVAISLVANTFDWRTVLLLNYEKYAPTTTGVDHDDDDDEHGSVLSRMKERGLDLSAAHQSKFNEKKGLLSKHFPESMLYQSKLQKYAANILNDDFA
jgi:hypothetical protein